MPWQGWKVVNTPKSYKIGKNAKNMLKMNQNGSNATTRARNQQSMITMALNGERGV